MSYLYKTDEYLKCLFWPKLVKEILLTSYEELFNFNNRLNQHRIFGLTTSCILYNLFFCRDRFPYYKANDERWKNSVRHNLSINPHFRKGARAPQGAGHLWSLAANAIDLLPLRNTSFEEEITELEPIQEARIIQCPKVIVLDEAAIAAASIIPDQDLFTGSKMFLNPVSAEQVVRECGLITTD
ncbi:unnamed protein product [Diatraea saccharalis]|uniref:Fork-head domain-containing protein n=1 Tax=Diatraea saccharalis TaxID=40085 RepID=A0A9N9R971_9NEOP|nr:unnamed protein product [Diatraea saccharalis]